MARIAVTDAAKAHIRDAVSRQRYTRPVFSIFWDPGQKDVRRGPKGEVVWDIARAASWKAGVFEWEVMPTELSNRPVPWEKLEISLGSQVEEFTGRVVVDYVNGTLSVDAFAI